MAEQTWLVLGMDTTLGLPYIVFFAFECLEIRVLTSKSRLSYIVHITLHIMQNLYCSYVVVCRIVVIKNKLGTTFNDNTAVLYSLYM